MLIKDAIDLKERAFISLVGAGGKSTLFSLLARELYQKKKRLVLTTTTHMFSSQLISDDKKATLIENDDEKIIEERMKYFFGKRKLSELILVHHRTEDEMGEKVAGPSPLFLSKCWQLGYADYFLVEADGARGRPIKAPTYHEPVICESTTDVIGVIGVDALGLSLNERNVFRPELFSQLTGLKMGDKISVKDIITLVFHPLGLFKNIPFHSRTHLFINKADDELKIKFAEKLAVQVLKHDYKRIHNIIIGKGINQAYPVIKVLKGSQ